MTSRAPPEPHAFEDLATEKQKKIIASLRLVQSLNSPFFPPHIGAEPGRAKEESREVQDNLHAHAQNEPIKNY